jgi:hypothetical protein
VLASYAEALEAKAATVEGGRGRGQITGRARAGMMTSARSLPASGHNCIRLAPPRRGHEDDGAGRVREHDVRDVDDDLHHRDVDHLPLRAFPAQPLVQLEREQHGGHEQHLRRRDEQKTKVCEVVTIRYVRESVLRMDTSATFPMRHFSSSGIGARNPVLPPTAGGRGRGGIEKTRSRKAGNATQAAQRRVRRRARENNKRPNLILPKKSNRMFGGKNEMRRLL